MYLINMRTIRLSALLLILLPAWRAAAQKIPDVSCALEDYNIESVTYWQSTAKVGKVQVAVLRDPAGEQEARFDLMHGASLLSLRYRGKELLYGQSAGASVALFARQRGGSYRMTLSPDQGGSSFGVPATTAGVACHGRESLRAFAMMIDRGADNSLQKEPLVGVWQGKVSDNFPPGYAAPFVIETNATWAENPGGKPRYYLRLDQSVVKLRPGERAAFEWHLTTAAPWDFAQEAAQPAGCTLKTPCTSRSVRALLAGRYQDAARTTGVAMVVPTAPWRTGSAYVLPNAEYIMLLYNAVWVAPRRTFAAVLDYPMEGVGAFRFHWYICAGAWDQARAFGERQPAGDENMLPPAPGASPTVVPERGLVAVGAACQVTGYEMQPAQRDQAVVLKDPAGEQTVLFDITQGGAIVSLKHRGVEHVWGYNGGGLLQMAFHNSMTNGPWRGDYNPTQAGDGSAMSPVTGVACEGTASVNTLTMMLDFNHNNAFYDKALISVWGGRVNDLLPPSYFSPYTLETRARWVPNPAGEPKYYLRLDERIVHVADEAVGPFGFDFAYYAAWDFGVRAQSPAKCPCRSSDTNYMAGGWYKDDARTTGLAVAMPSANFPGGQVRGIFAVEPMWRDRSFHLASREALDGISSKDFVWYVMAGSWENALRFAEALK